MEKVLIDTDVVIDYLRGYNSRIKKVFDKIKRNELKMYISCISIAELYSGDDAQNTDKEKKLTVLLSNFEIINFDSSLAIISGHLKNKYRLGLPDSIIAATAMKGNFKLITFNTKHFQSIPELKLYSI
jgi:predicted nucleic acid-binding protein